MSIFSALGSALGGLFGGGGKNPADAAMPYLQKLPGIFNNAYNPYIQHGEAAYGMLQPQMQQMMQNPSQLLASIGQHYQQSPGYQFQYKQAMDAAKAMGGATGMSGTPANQQQAAQMVGGVASQDYNNYLNHALGIYGQGLNLGQNMYNTGFNASNALANNMGSAYESMAKLGYAGQANQNQGQSGLFGTIGGLLGKGLSAIL